MTTLIPLDLNLIFWDTIGGIIKNLPIFILVIWGFRLIAKEIKQGVKNIPLWLEQWDAIKMKHYTIEKSRGIR